MIPMDFEQKKTDRIYRIFEMFQRLKEGKSISKSDCAKNFSVDMKTIQRDIQLLKNIITEYYQAENSLEYSARVHEYYLSNKLSKKEFLNQKAALLILTVLLRSRCIPREELKEILETILAQCKKEDAKQIRDVIGNELHHYVPVKHNKIIEEILWDIGIAKTKQYPVEIFYKKVRSDVAEKIVIFPLGIMFSEMYFYVLAQIKEEDNAVPICFRIDRIESYEIIEKEHFRIDYSKRLQEGEFRKKVQLMNTGELTKVKFKFFGKSLEAILDIFPNAKVLEENKDYAILVAQVFTKGAKMKFLSQAQYLEVLEPLAFRQEMKNSIQEMLKTYND